MHLLQAGNQGVFHTQGQQPRTEQHVLAVLLLFTRDVQYAMQATQGVEYRAGAAADATVGSHEMLPAQHLHIGCGMQGRTNRVGTHAPLVPTCARLQHQLAGLATKAVTTAAVQNGAAAVSKQQPALSATLQAFKQADIFLQVLQGLPVFLLAAVQLAPVQALQVNAAAGLQAVVPATLPGIIDQRGANSALHETFHTHHPCTINEHLPRQDVQPLDNYSRSAPPERKDSLVVDAFAVAESTVGTKPAAGFDFGSPRKTSLWYRHC